MVKLQSWKCVPFQNKWWYHNQNVSTSIQSNGEEMVGMAPYLPHTIVDLAVFWSRIASVIWQIFFDNIFLAVFTCKSWNLPRLGWELVIFIFWERETNIQKTFSCFNMKICKIWTKKYCQKNSSNRRSNPGPKHSQIYDGLIYIHAVWVIRNGL